MFAPIFLLKFLPYDDITQKQHHTIDKNTKTEATIKHDALSVQKIIWKVDSSYRKQFRHYLKNYSLHQIHHNLQSGSQR